MSCCSCDVGIHQVLDRVVSLSQIILCGIFLSSNSLGIINLLGDSVELILQLLALNNTIQTVLDVLFEYINSSFEDNGLIINIGTNTVALLNIHLLSKLLLISLIVGLDGFHSSSTSGNSTCCILNSICLQIIQDSALKSLQRTISIHHIQLSFQSSDNLCDATTLIAIDIIDEVLVRCTSLNSVVDGNLVSPNIQLGEVVRRLHGRIHQSLLELIGCVILIIEACKECCCLKSILLQRLNGILDSLQSLLIIILSLESCSIGLVGFNSSIKFCNLANDISNCGIPKSCWLEFLLAQLLGILSVLIDVVLNTIQRVGLSFHFSLQSLIIGIDACLFGVFFLSSFNSLSLFQNSCICQVCNSFKLIVSLNEVQEILYCFINSLLISYQEVLCLLYQIVSSLLLCIIGNVNSCQLFLHSIKVRYLLCQLLLELINLDFKIRLLRLSGLSLVRILNSLGY